MYVYELCIGVIIIMVAINITLLLYFSYFLEFFIFFPELELSVICDGVSHTCNNNCITVHSDQTIFFSTKIQTLNF